MQQHESSRAEPPRASQVAASQAAPHAGTSGPHAAPLRVGVMLDGWRDRAWVAKIIEDIQSSDVARVVTVVLNQSEPSSRWQALRARLPILLYLVYQKLDRWVFRRLLRVRHDAFDLVDLRPLLADAQVIQARPARNKFTDRMDAATLDKLAGERLDVILRFGFRIIRGPVLDTARYGVWSFHHGDNREYRGGPPMFWEMYEDNPACGVTLQVLTDQLDGGKVIYRTVEKTNAYSLYLNRNRNYLKAKESVLRRLRQIHAAGSRALTELDTYAETAPYTRGIYRIPGNLTMLGFLFRLSGRGLWRALLELATEEQWFVAWRRRPQPEPAVPAFTASSVRKLLPPRGIFYADPCLIERAGRHYLFFEDYEYASGLALISWVEILASGECTPPRVALATDYHLSYPFVFEHGGQTYMIPETRARRRIELWRATSFPDRWTLDRVMIDNIGAVDATWLEHGGKYWLLAGVGVEGGLASSELHVFSSSEPFGPWTPHRDNPVVATIRGARPAGRVFRRDGQLIRPAQDCAKVYGHRVILYRVEQLDDDGYRETPLGVIEPEWFPGNLGTHTYNSDDAYETLDGRVRILRGPRLRRRKISTE